MGWGVQRHVQLRICPLPPAGGPLSRGEPMMHAAKATHGPQRARTEMVTAAQTGKGGRAPPRMHVST